MRRFRLAAALVLACFGVILLARCGGGSNTISVEIQPSIAQTVDASAQTCNPPMNLTGCQMINFTAAVGGDKNNSGVTWNLTVLSTGCAGTGCGTLLNPTIASVTYVAPSNIGTELTGVVLQAVSKANANTTQSVDISVVLDPTFSLGALQQCALGVFCLPSGSNGIAYNSNQALAVTNGVPPYTFTTTPGTTCPAGPLSIGTLPPGLTLNPGTGAIIGKPTCPTATNAAITFQFTVQATDSSATPVSVFQAFQITITPPPTLAITTTSLAPGTVGGAYTASISTNGGVTPLTFSILNTVPNPDSCATINGLLPAGLMLNPASGQVTGIPKGPPVSCSFTIQVVDSSLSPPPNTPQTKTQLISATINAPQPLAITSNPNLPAGFTATTYGPLPLIATGGVGPYTWTVTTGQLPAGLTLGPDGTISGTPVLATSPPTNTFFTVQVADSERDPITGLPAPQTVTRTFNITINTGMNSNSLLNGQYTFLFNGFDVNGPVTIIGTVIMGGNGVLSGEEDIYRLSGVISNPPAPVSGVYLIGTDGRGTMELVATSPISNAALTTDYRLVLDSGGGSGHPNVRFFEDNSTNTNTDTSGTHGEGIMKPVVGSNFTDASFSGNYAFGFSGYESAGKLPVALAGVVHADSTAPTPSLTGTCDFNDAGAYSSQPLSGTFSTTVDGFGRSIAQLDFAQPGKSQVTLSFVFYFVSPSDIFFMENDNTPAVPAKSVFFLLNGEMLLQQPGYQFTNAAFLPVAGPPSTSGVSVATGTGLRPASVVAPPCAQACASVFAGLLTGVTSGNAALSYDENNGGTLASPSFTGTYSVANNGRASFMGLGSTAATTRVAAAYLTGPGQGFLIGSDTAVTTGLLELQTSQAPIIASSLQGGYTLGTGVPAENQVTNVIGQVYSDGSVNMTGTVDEYDPPSLAPPEGALNLGKSITFSNYLVSSTGRGTVSTNWATAAAGSPKSFPTNLIFYIVSPGSFRAISADSTPGTGHPVVYFFDH
jgi:Putative Ig domain